MSSQHDFLNPDTEQIRHQIRGILESYSHDWDILAELLQNSVDAIRQKASGKGHINLKVDAANRIIRVNDNGCGIDSTDVAKLLRPFGTNKNGKPNQIGEKGVGLKFVMFSSSSFCMSSTGSEGSCSAEVLDASKWVESESAEKLYLNINEASKLSEGTEVEIKVTDPDHPLFGYSFEQLLFLIRTRTACGDCGFIWASPLDADVHFTFIGKDGTEKSKEFECRYLLPTECINKSDTISIDEFQQWLKDGDRSDQEKRKKLIGKVVTTIGKKYQSGREIRYWSCFVPRRDFWRILSEKVNLPLTEEEEEGSYSVGFSSGFATSTKAMPTGISIELKPRGSAGYVPNYFIIVDDPSLRFDIGRKSVQGRQQGMLREIAYDNFREYINKTQKYMGGTIEPSFPNWNRDEVFDEIEELPNLDSDKTCFIKRPNGQEATVAAIFFELLGKGYMPDIRPLISGYKGRYDLYAKWDRRRVVLEFKYDLAGLLNDFNDEKKMFDEIDTVILWEVTEKDRLLAGRRGINIDEVQESHLISVPKFPGATKLLTLSNVNPIWIIELKSILGA